MDRAHRVVSGCSGRIFKAPWWFGGLERQISSQEIFGGSGNQLFKPFVQIRDPDGHLARIHGRIGYLGAGYTDPQHRERGLMTIAVLLAQAHLVRRYRADHVCAFVRPVHSELALSPRGYSFSRLVPTAVEYCAGSGFPERFQFVHATSKEVAARWRSGFVPAPSSQEQLVLAFKEIRAA